jgi:hypothetical protein
MKFIASIFLFVLFIAIGTTACKKGGSTPNPPTTTEENLVIALDPDPGTTTIKALGTSYDFKVIIQSKMPANGVTINITYRKDADNSVISSQNLESSTTPVSVTVNNITAEVGTVTVTVTSKTKGTNTATKSFKLVKKV